MTARLGVEQPDADLVVTIISPDGVQREVDGFDFGTEPVTIIANPAGIYRIRVAPLRSGRSPVKFSAFLESIQAAAGLDSQRVHAEDIATESKRKARLANEDWHPALDLLQTSLGLWSQLGEPDAIARTHLKMGDLYFNKGIWDSARSEYREAKQLCDPVTYLRCYAEAVNNIGLTSLDLAELDEAQSELLAARQAWEKLQLPLIEAITNSNLGLLFWESGEWQFALEQFDSARKLFERRSPLSNARTLNNIGLVYMSMAEYEKASNYFLKALQIVLPLNGALQVQARIRINLGRVRTLMGQLKRALRDLRLAVFLMKRNGDTNGLAEALNNLGQAQLRCSRVHEAKASLNTAFSLYQEIHDQSGLSSALHYLGTLAAKEGDYRGATEQLQHALKIRLDRGLRDDAGETLYQLAIVERETGQHEQSRQHIQEAIAQAQSLRTNVGGEFFRRSYFASRQKYSEFFIEGLLSDRSHDEDDVLVTRAFEACERARARSLVDLLGEDRLSLREADPALLARRRSVQRRLNFRSVQLAALAGTSVRSASEARLRREIDELLGEDAEVESTLQSQIPNYRDAVQPSIVTGDDVRGLLSQNDVFLEYFLGQTRSFVWVINREHVRITELPQRTYIEHLARSVVSLLGEVQARSSDPQKEAAFELASRRLAVAIHLSLDEGSGPSRTIIVPDGFLSHVPFAVLPTGGGKRSGDRSPKPLGLISEVVQVPSASVFRILKAREKKAEAPASVAVFADPVFDGLDARVKTNEMAAPHAHTKNRNSIGLPLARLSFSQIEAETVEHLLPPTRRRVFRGFDATKSNLFGSEVRSYTILLLSTHAFADDRQPELSSIVLSMVDEQGSPVDGLVHLYDVYALRLNSFVILSGCETASGREVRGEGLIGLSRGFLQAGASGLLASPYRIDAESSAFLIGAFLEGILGPQSLSPSQALLKARRTLARSTRWKDPYYWGSFVLVSGLS